MTALTFKEHSFTSKQKKNHGTALQRDTLENGTMRSGSGEVTAQGPFPRTGRQVS